MQEEEPECWVVVDLEHRVASGDNHLGASVSRSSVCAGSGVPAASVALHRVQVVDQKDRQTVAEGKAVDPGGMAAAAAAAVEVGEHHVEPRSRRMTQEVGQDEVELAAAAAAGQVGSVVVGKVAAVAPEVPVPAVEVDTAVT